VTVRPIRRADKRRGGRNKTSPRSGSAGARAAPRRRPCGCGTPQVRPTLSAALRRATAGGPDRECGTSAPLAGRSGKPPRRYSRYSSKAAASQSLSAICPCSLAVRYHHTDTTGLADVTCGGSPHTAGGRGARHLYSARGTRASAPAVVSPSMAGIVMGWLSSSALVRRTARSARRRNRRASRSVCAVVPLTGRPGGGRDRQRSSACAIPGPSSSP
jgi:hypothetical protein